MLEQDEKLCAVQDMNLCAEQNANLCAEQDTNLPFVLLLLNWQPSTQLSQRLLQMASHPIHKGCDPLGFALAARNAVPF